MQHFIFLRPLFGLLLLPLASILALAWWSPKQFNEWHKYIDQVLLDFLLPHTTAVGRRRLLIAMAVTWLMTCVALMGPSFRQHRLPANKLAIPRIILLDLSDNMLQNDVQPNRLERAKFKIEDLIKQQKESELALVVFSEEPFLVSPFTSDQRTLTNFLQRLNPELMPVAGSNIEKALTFSLKRFQKNKLTNGQVILVTGSIPNPGDYDVAKALANAGFSLSILGIGETNQLPNRAYANLAKKGHGTYQIMTVNNQDIAKLLNTFNTHHLVKRHNKNYLPEDSGYYLVFMISFVVLLGFRRGWFETLTQV